MALRDTFSRSMFAIAELAVIAAVAIVAVKYIMPMVPLPSVQSN